MLTQLYAFCRRCDRSNVSNDSAVENAIIHLSKVRRHLHIESCFLQFEPSISAEVPLTHWLACFEYRIRRYEAAEICIMWLCRWVGRDAGRRITSSAYPLSCFSSWSRRPRKHMELRSQVGGPCLFGLFLRQRNSIGYRSNSLRHATPRLEPQTEIRCSLQK